MFWADRIAEEIEKRFAGEKKSLLIRDEKTVSGRVHVGSMRGVVIHGIMAEILTEKGIVNSFSYEFNDFDPMDDIPTYLPREKFEPYLGKPLREIPSPEPSAKNFAEYFAADFKNVILDEGFTPTFYWSSDLYFSGKMDDVIREALLSAETIRRIYREVSGSQRNEEWLPLSVLCPQCGKLSTTRALDFDGETVAVECRDIEWTTGCGFQGRVNPFGGKAKLPWKVEWPAKWKVLGVAIEGAGKDHSTKGGSRDVANRIAEEVFHYTPPFDMPYEFILVGGKKMSSSKGRGSSAREIADLLPPKLFRLAILSKDIMQAVNFDPEGDTIPVLYDLYDRLAQGYYQGLQDDYARLFTLVHTKEEQKDLTPLFLVRFSQIAFLVQMPHLDLLQEAAALKGGSLTEKEQEELQERATYAKKWLSEYAPEKFVFKLQDTLPPHTFTDLQKQALKDLHEYLSSHSGMPSGEVLHKELHAIKDRHELKPQDFFGALYRSFLNKESGPQAGWFLSVLPKDFVLDRLAAAAA